MEATGIYWKPVWHMLEDGFTLVLANAQHIRNVPGRKTDVNDAMWIADLLAHGLIRSSFVPPAPIHELRDLTRTRKQLVREITIGAIAHRLCRLIWKILHDGIRYEERGGERQKQQVRARAARMIRQLRNLGYQI